MANTELDDLIVPLVQELLDQFGQAAIYSSNRSDDYDPETSTKDSKPSRVPIKIVFDKVERFNRDSQPASVKVRARRIYCAGADLTSEPNPEDSIIVTGVGGVQDRTYTIADVIPIYSGEQVALWELYIEAM